MNHEIRVLLDSELEKWFDFVYDVFKEKTTREYFVNHHQNDPFSSVDSIVVATTVEENEIVGTVKTFHRLIQIKDWENDGFIRNCKCKGIGEVSVRSDYRRKGIAQSLLNLSVERMQTETGDLVLSSLHASPEISEVYRKLGWQSIPLHFSKLSFKIEAPNYNDRQCGSVEIYNTDFTKQDVMQLYDKFCKHYKFNGCEIRNYEKKYWCDWVRHESTTHKCKSYSLFENGVLSAYLIIGPHLSNSSDHIILKVKEFACHVDSSETNFHRFFTLLSSYVKQEYFGEMSIRALDILLPLPLTTQVFNISNLSNTVDIESLDKNVQGHLVSCIERAFTDTGYMYKIIKQPAHYIKISNLIEEEMHLVWKTDGF